MDSDDDSTSLITNLIATVAPLFIATSPITSYADQIRSISTTRTSANFSLDTPLILLLSSILRCFYWLGARFEHSLLIQSLLQIATQSTLLKVALDHRRPSSTTPFSISPSAPVRPYRFWQWPQQKPYWSFLLSFFAAVAALQLLFGRYGTFVRLLGVLGLGIECTLPVPQVLQNWRRGSADGLRLSVVANWIVGDVMKLVFFWQAEHVGRLFKICACVQFALDCVLGAQFWWFGKSGAGTEKDLRA